MKMYDLKELAKILKMNIRTLQKYVREGRLKASKVGTHYIVTEEDLQDFLEEQKVKPIADTKETKQQVEDILVNDLKAIKENGNYIISNDNLEEYLEARTENK